MRVQGSHHVIVCALQESISHDRNAAQERIAKLSPAQMRLELRSACRVRERLISAMTAAHVLTMPLPVTPSVLPACILPSHRNDCDDAASVKTLKFNDENFLNVVAAHCGPSVVVSGGVDPR